MPYVVTTYRMTAAQIAESDEPIYPTMRHVETLDEAKQAASEIIDRAWGPYAPTPTTSVIDDGRHYQFRSDALRIPESGGTLGPLPDGTVVEIVEEVEEGAGFCPHGIHHSRWCAQPDCDGPRCGHRHNSLRSREDGASHGR